MTEKLYYIDSHMKAFTATVTSCEKNGDRFEVTLDRTAFFPEGGGQLGDSGVIGGVRVFDTHEKNGEIKHYVNQALETGKTYDCAIDWETRFRRMQNHSGEHIVSGLVHKKYGYNNVGFHMGSDVVTIDFDGELSWEQLLEIEREANRAIAANYKVTATFPAEDVLKTLEYRSKLELTENVRIVEIENTDICACCAPHVNSTAEVGTVRILTAERRRRGGDGVRITMLCGLDAFEHEVIIDANNAEVSTLLSAKRTETAAAVRRLDHKFFVSFNHLQQVLDLILHFNHADEVRGGNADFLRQNLGLYFVVHQRIKAAVVALGNNAEIPPVHAQNAGFPKRGGRGEIFQPAETKHCSAFLCQR